MKKIILLIFFLIIFVFINAHAVDIKGDVNGDGKIGVQDYILVRKSILNIQVLTNEEVTRADTNSDGKINSIDYINIRKNIISGQNNDSSKWTVSFDSSGGSSVSSQKIADGGKAVSPTEPKRNGYVFIEWELNNKKYDFNKEVKGNINLVAIWGKLEKDRLDLKTNGKENVSYTIDPKTSGVTIKYSTSDKSVATVSSSGSVKGIGAGSATITVKANDIKIGSVDTVVDYSFLETCSTDKSNTKVTIKTDKNKSVKVYSCLENQNWFHQGFAITNDKIIYTRALYTTWCKPGGSYEVAKYNLKGKCDSENYAVTMSVSGNIIKIYDKKTGKITNNYMDVGGHGQGFDATYNNELYINYFPKLTLSSTYGYGAHSIGIAYINKFVGNKEYLIPNKTTRILKNGEIKQYKSSYEAGTIDYFKDIIAKAKESSVMSSIEFGVDEDHDQIAILNKSATSNGNRVLYIYKLSDFKKGVKTLLGTYYLYKNTCAKGNGYCGHQGIELYGDYLYSVQELDVDGASYESVSKIQYKTCSKTDKASGTCKVENLNIPEKSLGTEYGKKLVGINEIEGVSIYKGKVYVSVMTNKFSDGKRKNILLLLDGF